MRAHTSRFAVRALILVTALVSGWLAGCRSESLHRNNALVRAVKEQPIKKVRAGSADAVMETAGLSRLKPAEAFARLEPRAEVAPTPELLVTLGELALRAGAKAEHGNRMEALEWYRNAAVYSALALGEPGTAAIDPQVAQVIHERAVVKCLRLSGAAARDGRKEPIEWRSALGAVGVQVVTVEATWEGIGFDAIWPASDFRYEGLENTYERAGLGVPVVLYRDYRDDGELSGQEKFFPKRLKLGATLVMRPGGGALGGGWRSAPVALEVHDPVDNDTVVMGGVRLPLAADYSTSIAHQFIDSQLQAMEYAGLLNPDAVRDYEGIYMPEPFEPEKIPVLFLHGLWSSPRTWMNVFNELRGDEELRKRYQFWFGFYTTGDPVPVSAAKMRKSLKELRATVDPGNQNPVMSNMVLVGHSMGSVVGRSMVQSSGDRLERRLLSRPLASLSMSSKTRAELEHLLHFEADPQMRRMLFLAGPFRGSSLANRLIGRTTSALVQRSREVGAMREELIALNGDDVFNPPWDRRLLSGVDNLEEGSPLLEELDKLPIAPWVTYHTVVGNIRPFAGDDFEKMSDGVVPAPSAHLDGAASERIIPRSHFMVASPEVIEEVQRVLRLHLAEGQVVWNAGISAGVPVVEMPGVVVEDSGEAAQAPVILTPTPTDRPVSRPSTPSPLPAPPPEGVNSPFSVGRPAPGPGGGVEEELLPPLEPLQPYQARTDSVSG